MISKNDITGIKTAGKKVIEFQYTLECGDDWHKKFITMVFKARTMRFWNCMAYIPSVSGRNMTVVDVNLRASEDTINDSVIKQMVETATKRIKEQMLDAISCMGGVEDDEQ